jgi:hypothetical protein
MTPMQPERRPLRDRAGDEHGIALIISLMVMMLMMALGVTLVMTTMTETKIAGNYRDGTEALYAADAGLERVLQDILTVYDWNEMIDPAQPLKSAFIDGDEEGRTLPDGTQLNLRQATNMLNCGSIENCSDADMNAITDERPWALNNPRWKLYAHGPIAEMLPTDVINSQFYVVVWVADDASENDNNPARDGESKAACAPPDDCSNPGRGVIAMRAQAYGPGGVQRAVEVTLARTNTLEIERGYTGQRGQDEQNRRARKAAVQTPGKTLSRNVLQTGG